MNDLRMSGHGQKSFLQFLRKTEFFKLEENDIILDKCAL